MRVQFTIVGIVAVLAVFCVSSGAEAGLIWSENFSSHPDLSSGNWHSNITDAAVPTAGTWSTSDGTALSNTAGSGTIQATAQYAFTASEKSAFGSLYDSGSGLIGGGSASGTLYIRFDGGYTTAPSAPQFAFFQTQRGSTTNRSLMDSASYAAASVGKGWNATYYNALINIATASGSLDGPLSTSMHAFVMKINFQANSNSAESLSIWTDPTAGLDEPQQVSPAYIGTGDLSFDTFVLRVGNANVNWHWDNIKFGTAFSDVFTVPEPATMTLFAAGLLGAIGFARRRFAR